MEQLEKEAKEFKQKRTPPSTPDVEAYRYYMGIALKGILERGLTAPEEALEEAAKLAVLAIQKERNFRGA
jgi:hypothetical protein